MIENKKIYLIMLVNAHKLFVILLLFIGWNTVRAQEVWTSKQLVDKAQKYNLNLAEENMVSRFIVQSIKK